jgi:PAS domain S-box-containing protein
MDSPPSAILQAILEGSRHPLLVLSREGIVIEANRAALNWMELRREALVGRRLRELPLWSGSPSDNREFEIKQCTFSVRRLRGSDLLIAEGRDLAAVEAEQQRARLVFELANMGVWTWNLGSDTVSNQSDRGVFGWMPMVNASREEAMARIHPEDRAFLLAEADAAVASRSGFRVEVRGIVPGTGEIKWVAVTGAVRCDEDGKPVRVDGVTVDITERKETELRLRESEIRFRAIFENAGIGIALVGADGVLVESNPALEQLLGYTAAEFQKLHFGEFTHRDDLNRDLGLYQDLIAGRRKRYQIEKRYIRKDGELIWGKLVVSAVRDAAGHAVFGIGMVEDITEKKRVEQEVLSLSDKLIYTQEQERSRIARELHDGLGQQIAALSISVASLKRQIPESDAEGRERVLRLQQRIAAISEGVRRISHDLHPAVLELAGIVPALRSYCRQFSSDNGMAVSLDAGENFEHISTDAALCLYRIAQEALQNVAKHSGAKEARVALQRASEGVLMTVADRGRGFDAEAPAAHAGLGLVSMQERARLLNGRLRIASLPGAGTTLEVLIPLAAETAVSEAAGPRG